MNKLSLQVQPRTILGRKVKRLRRDGLIPANIYGKEVKSLAVAVSLTDFRPVFRKAGETNLVELKVKDEKEPRQALIHYVQLHPVSNQFLHVDFHQVSLKEETEVEIPVKVIGESPGVKQKGGVLLTLLNEIKVKALPTDLPDSFEIDIAKLEELGAEIRVSDLKVPKNVTVLNSANELVLQVAEPAKAEEEKPAETVAPADSADLPDEALAKSGASVPKAEGATESQAKPAETPAKPEKAS